MNIVVKAAPGKRVIAEGNPAQIIGDEPVQVVSSHYYRQFLAQGDLVQVTETQQDKTTTKKGKE